MNRIFYNENGETYYILFGGIGQKSMLCSINEEKYVICKLLQPRNWWQGDYFQKFEKAYDEWKGK